RLQYLCGQRYRCPGAGQFYLAQIRNGRPLGPRSERSSGPMMRRLLALVLVLVLYVLIGGLLAEGVVRVLRVAPPAQSPGYFWQTNHPVTGWTLQPDAAGRWFNPMYEY